MKDTQKYWNPLIETLPQEALRALQLKKFRRIFQWAYDNSGFHRSLYDKAGVKPADIRSLEDIKHVPKVEKAMLRDIQFKAPFPYGDALCVPIEEVTEFRQTSGTTGQPVYQPDTWQDWEWWSECWCYVLWAQGYRPADRLQHLRGVLGRTLCRGKDRLRSRARWCARYESSSAQDPGVERNGNDEHTNVRSRNG